MLCFLLSALLLSIEPCVKSGDPSPHYAVFPLYLSTNAAVDVIEEAWNSTLLQKRYAFIVASMDFDLTINGGIPRSAFLDAGRARQVICNIVGNAVKFSHEVQSGATAAAPAGAGASAGVPVMSKRGSISLDAKFDEENRLLRIVVRDSGRGISEEGIARLFKP
jgi:signal transduction histidine kinase